MAKKVLTNIFPPENVTIKVSKQCKNAHLSCVLRFGTICIIMKNKNTCGVVLISVKVGGWLAASLKLAFLPKCFS